MTARHASADPAAGQPQRPAPQATRGARPRPDPLATERADLLRCCRVRAEQYATEFHLAQVRPEEREVYVFLTVGDEARGHFAAGQHISRYGVAGTVMTGVVTDGALLVVFPLVRLMAALRTPSACGHAPAAGARVA